MSDLVTITRRHDTNSYLTQCPSRLHLQHRPHPHAPNYAACAPHLLPADAPRLKSPASVHTCIQGTCTTPHHTHIPHPSLSGQSDASHPYRRPTASAAKQKHPCAALAYTPQSGTRTPSEDHLSELRHSSSAAMSEGVFLVRAAEVIRYLWCV